SGGSSASDGGANPGDASASGGMTFFVTSTGSGAMGGNLGGLEMADKKCKDLATAVGAGDKQWVAWLSVEKGPTGAPVNAKDRVGTGPWRDVKGRVVATVLADLLTGINMRSKGEMAAVDDLLDEKGN